MHNRVSGSVAAVLLSLSIPGLMTSCASSNSKADASGPPPVAVQVQTLQSTTLQDSTEYVGTLQAEQTVALNAQVAGQIAEVLVRPGDKVRQGQQIFRLTPNQNTSELASAQANTSAAIAARNTAFKQVQAARSQIASEQAQYDLDRVNNGRQQFLAARGASAQSTADQALATLKTQDAALQAAREQFGAAQAALNQADANIQKARAQTETARVGLDLTRAVSPIIGSVGDITLKVGDYVTAGQTLTTITQNSSFDLKIPVPIGYSSQLHPGIVVKLLDPTSGSSLSTGSIYFVSPQTTSTAQTIQTRARFPNSNGNLRDSQYVRARVIWKTRPGVLVPTEAVSPIGGQNFVFVSASKTNKDGKAQTIAQQVPVTLGSIQGQAYQVLKGLSPGDAVIVSGVSKLHNESPITPQQNNGSSQS